MSMFLYFSFVICAVAFGIVIFLLISAGDLATFKKIHDVRQQSHSTLPLISRYGDVISSPEELEDCLNTLKLKLRDKYQELENTKIKMKNRVDSLQKLETYKRGCWEMHADLVKIEEQCKELEMKIDYFRRLQERVETENVASMMTATSFAGDFMTYNTRVAL